MAAGRDAEGRNHVDGGDRSGDLPAPGWRCSPGLSRSGGTILVALLLGTNRVLATEFSFLVGIPTLLAAGVLKIYKALKVGSGEDCISSGLRR